MTTGAESVLAERAAPSALAVFVDRRTIVMLLLGFSAGLPFMLVFDTLSAWLRAVGISLEVIGFFSLVTMVYAFKFLWAPFVDRTSIPLLTGWLGHRRSWMLVCQGMVMVGLWLVAGTDPAHSLTKVAVFAVFVGFSSATQDISIDAWRIEVVDASRHGAMAAAYTWGYRVATLVAGAVPLLLAGPYGWNVSYASMAALMTVGVIGVLAAPAEAQHIVRAIHADDIPRAPFAEAFEWIARLAVLVAGALLLGSGLTGSPSVLAQVLSALGADALSRVAVGAWTSDARAWVHLLAAAVGLGVVFLAAMAVPGVRTRPGVYLSAALADPLRDIFRRHRSTATLILALICLYRISDFVLNIMNPFYLDLGFSLLEIAEVRKVFGVAMIMIGVFAAGYSVARLGLLPSLIIGAIVGPASNLAFIWLAIRGHNLPALFVAIGTDNVTQGFAGTCLIAYMSSLTSAAFTATQYTLLSSLYAIPGKVIASQSGRIVEGAAHAAEAGGVLGRFNPLFAALPPESFAHAVERSGVSPASLGTGYFTFFVYSTLIGILPIVLVWMVWKRTIDKTVATNDIVRGLKPRA